MRRAAEAGIDGFAFDASSTPASSSEQSDSESAQIKRSCATCKTPITKMTLIITTSGMRICIRGTLPRAHSPITHGSTYTRTTLDEIKLEHGRPAVSPRGDQLR